jgi:site-specific DNA-cytosine methylase
LESKARQVGNAVPPLMAKAIGRAYVKHASAVGTHL